MDLIVDTSQVSQLAALWAKAPDITREEMLRAVTEADLMVQAKLMEDLPRGAGGRHGAGLVGSVHREEMALADRVIGMTATDKAYANYVEAGTRPHKPPIQPLQDWVQAVIGLDEDEALGMAFAIRNTIAKKGTHKQPVWQDTYRELLPKIQRAIAAGMQRVQARLEANPA